MAEKESKKSGKADGGRAKAWLEGLKSEFRKIIWPDKQTLVKETVAVVGVITAVLGVLISVFDAAILEGINL